MGVKEGARPDPTTPLAGRTRDDEAASQSRVGFRREVVKVISEKR